MDGGYAGVDVLRITWRHVAGRLARHAVAPAIAAASIIAPQPSYAATLKPAAAGVRAMWVWGRPAPDQVVSWAATHGVVEIFAEVDADTVASGDYTRLRDLKRRADTARIRVSALGGDASWTFDHTSALAWQRSVVRSGLFAAQHLDVEPYVLAAWNTDRTATAQSYLSLLTKLRQAATLPLEADLPFWYDTVNVGGRNLAAEALSRVSAVTIMSYRDTAIGPNAILALSADMLDRGSRAGKPVRLAAETQPLADCPYCTFAEEGQAVMATVLATVDQRARAYPAFAGVAVHHFDSWRALRP